LGVARGNLSRRAGAVGAAVGRGWVVARAGAGHGTTATSSGAAAPAAVARPATIDGIWRTALASARVASIARTREASCSVRAQRIRVAVVERAVIALVNVLACFTRAFVAGIALARKAAGCVRAGSVGIAVMRAISALVDVLAVLAVAEIAGITGARVTTGRVRARSVGIAIVGATAALVHVSTALAVARVASIARARETTCSVRAQRVRVAVVERAVVALVDVLACFTRAFVAGIALAREAAGCI